MRGSLFSREVGDSGQLTEWSGFRPDSLEPLLQSGQVLQFEPFREYRKSIAVGDKGEDSPGPEGKLHHPDIADLPGSYVFRKCFCGFNGFVMPLSKPLTGTPKNFFNVGYSSSSSNLKWDPSRKSSSPRILPDFLTSFAEMESESSSKSLLIFMWSSLSSPP